MCTPLFVPQRNLLEFHNVEAVRGTKIKVQEIISNVGKKKYFHPTITDAIVNLRFRLDLRKLTKATFKY